MTRLLLVRHAAAAHLGATLAGRAPDVHLDAQGRAQATDLARALARVRIDAIYAGPLERTRETAALVAAAHGLVPRVDEAFDEVDFGAWTGLRFDRLDTREDWRRWNLARGTARAPGGESMAEVLDRALAGVLALGARHSGGRVVVVSHCDVIRPLLAHFLGLPLDHILRFDVDPASVSTVALHARNARVLTVNRTLDPP